MFITNFLTELKADYLNTSHQKYKTKTILSNINLIDRFTKSSSLQFFQNTIVDYQKKQMLQSIENLGGYVMKKKNISLISSHNTTF
jgi:hypothetical protein